MHEFMPLWLLAELTYACPLQCAYCSNPINYPDSRKHELTTDEWKRVLGEARALGAVQLGFSGGEPLSRSDLEQLVAHARGLGFYTNLITSALGMDEARLTALREAGLDHVQISFQSSTETRNNRFAGCDSFAHKQRMAKAVKAAGLPMVLNFVLHRDNIDEVDDILRFAEALGADYVELANTQYYGWALKNRAHLLPTREQLQFAEEAVAQFRARHQGNMQVFFVVPDYYADRPKPCSNGWGTTFITVTPEGLALPCHAARELPNIELPNVREQSLSSIWKESSLFNAYRGDEWMRDPCRSCPERQRDFGGCRCQAFLLTGDASNADPVCALSPQHSVISDVIAGASSLQPLQVIEPVLMRNPRNSSRLLDNSPLPRPLPNGGGELAN